MTRSANATRSNPVVRRSWARIRPYRRASVAAAALLVATTIAALSGPIILRYGINHGLTSAHPDRGVLDRAAGVYLVVVAAGLVMARTQVRLVSDIAERFLRDLRVEVFDHIVAMAMDFFDRQPAGALVARMTSDIDALEELVQTGLITFLQSALALVVLLVIMLILSWKLTIVCLAGMPLLVVASVRFRRRSHRAYLTVRDRVGQTLASFEEGISGVRVIQAYGREDDRYRLFARRNQDQLDANLASLRISLQFFPILELSGVLCTAAVVAVGGLLIHRGEVSIGTVSAFVLYLLYFFDPLQQVSQLYNTVETSAASLAKLYALLDTRPSLREHPEPEGLPRRAHLVARAVCFSYPDRPDRPDCPDRADGPDSPLGPVVVRDIDLDVAPGERLALVGPTGCGKSTLAKLLARVHDPVSGTVTYGGVDLRRASGDALRSRIVVVPQEAYLFAGTVLDNVRLARPGASDEEAMEAIGRVGAEAHFAALPRGVRSEVGEGGSGLSAGQRQLVSLARAALSTADVVVLDEATSSLDPRTVIDVESALERLMAGRSVIVIAHRLSTAARADRIAVLDEGGLAELGTHAELLALGGRYAALYEHWRG